MSKSNNNKIDTNDLEYAQERGINPKGWIPCPRGEGGKINPQVTQMYLGDNTFYTVFHVKPVYYETLDGSWRPLSEVASHVGNHKVVMEDWHKVHPRYINWLNKRMKLIGGELLLPTMIPTSIEAIQSLQYARVGHIGLTVTTVYPDPDPETTTVDGRIQHSNSTWSTVRDAATGTSPNDSADWLQFQTSHSGGNYIIARVITLFDTSSIGSDTVDSATYSLYLRNGTVFNFNSLDLDLVSSSPASDTAIVAADYDKTDFGSTAFDSYAIPTSSLNQYYDHTPNASGLAAINGSGVTKYGVRTSGDVDNVATSTGEKYNQGLMSSADQTGTSEDPKLAVTHTATASTFIPKVMMF